MKRILTTLLAGTILCASLCACGEPTSSPIADFSYSFEDGTAIITGYHGSDLDIVIPSEINERPVRVIGEKAFKDYDMESVYLPDSVTLIQSQAFYSCSNLKSVNIPDSVTEMHDYVFGWCESLSELKLPNSVTEIGDSLLHYCEDNVTVYVKSGSYAETYAKEEGLNYKVK